MTPTTAIGLRELLAEVLWLSERSRGGATPPIPPSWWCWCGCEAQAAMAPPMLSLLDDEGVRIGSGAVVVVEGEVPGSPPAAAEREGAEEGSLVTARRLEASETLESRRLRRAGPCGGYWCWLWLEALREADMAVAPPPPLLLPCALRRARSSARTRWRRASFSALTISISER